MKKVILFSVAILFAVLVNAQTKTYYLQNVSANFSTQSKGKIFTCVDTVQHKDFACQLSKQVDSVSACPEYTAFLSMCKTISEYDTICAYVCQHDPKQSFTNHKRIIVRKNNTTQKIFNVDALTSAQQATYNAFIAKVITLLKTPIAVQDKASKPIKANKTKK